MDVITICRALQVVIMVGWGWLGLRETLLPELAAI